MLFSRMLPVYSPLPAKALRAALASGDPRASLARSLAEAYGADEVVLTASGTVALTLALLAASARRPGAPVAMPGYACYDLVTAAVGAGVRVVLYDLEPATLAPEPRSLAAALANGAAALVVVHLFGVPVPLDAMRDAAERAGALLIEDAAQATGGQWDARPLGSFGDLSVLSFGRGKGETGGGGGALLLRRGAHLPPALRARIGDDATAALPFAAKLAVQWAFGRPSLYAIPAALPMLRLGETIYREPPPLRAMAPASARVLEVTRPLATAEAAARRHNADALREVLGARASAIGVQPGRGGESGWLRLPIRLRIAPHLVERGRQLGWATAYPLPLAALPAIAPLVVQATRTLGAERLAQTLSTLPTHGLVSDEMRAKLARWLSDSLAASNDE